MGKDECDRSEAGSRPRRGRGSDENVRPLSKQRGPAAMISSKRSSTLPLIACFLLLGATAAAAQQPQAQYRPILPSQKASVMQTIGVTDVTISYSRPAIKGRTIFADAPPAIEGRAKGEATIDTQNERKPG